MSSDRVKHMASAATKPMTAAEFYGFVHRPENQDRAFELERGQVIELPTHGKRHGLICANVTWMLGTYVAARRKGYVCSNNVGVVVERNPDTVRGPDVMLFEDATSIDDVEEKYGETPPRLAVEVLSPNDNLTKLDRRIQELIACGIPLVWVVDSEQGTVSVHRPGNHIRVIEKHGILTGEDVLPGFRCNLSKLFNLPGQ